MTTQFCHPPSESVGSYRLRTHQLLCMSIHHRNLNCSEFQAKHHASLLLLCNMPLFTFGPWIPCGPWFPLGPVTPRSPTPPLNPTSPWCPSSPLSPWSPLSPRGPGRPSIPCTWGKQNSQLRDTGMGKTLCTWKRPKLSVRLHRGLPKVGGEGRMGGMKNGGSRWGEKKWRGSDGR